MVSCVHHVPGRARFKLDALRRDPDLAERIHAEVSRLPGISGVEVNRHAASVIVHYCTERGDLSLVMDHICVHCPKSAAARRAGALAPIPEPAVGRPIRVLAGPKAPRLTPEMTRAMGDALGKAVVNTFIRDTVERSLARLLVGLR